MRNCKLLISITVVLMLIMQNAGIASAFVAYNSYYYSRSGTAINIEDPFICTDVIVDFNGDKLSNPMDIFVHGDDIFIVDTGNSRILKLDSDYNITLQINEFSVNGVDDRLDSPNGIFVSDDDLIYVADTNKARIVVFDIEGNFVETIKPYGQDYDDPSQPFVPTSLVIDKTGRLLINSRQVFKGIVSLNPDGQFIGYFGANRARINPLEYFWKSIATREQRAGMVLDVPTEIAKIHLDKEGFPYVISNAFPKAVTYQAVEAEMPVRRLNLTGSNILNFSDSDIYPIGDVSYVIDIDNNRGASNFVDICSTDFGIYFLLDSSRGRIFVYNQTGRNIFTFSGRGGTQTGTLRSPSSLDMYGSKLLVLDRQFGSLNVFEPTKFGMLILGALQMHYEGEYDSAKNYWEQVRDNYGYYDLAYLGIGKVLLYDEDYEGAMEYFMIARDREYYSSAFKFIRKNIVENNFILIWIIIIAFILFLTLGMKHIKKYFEMKLGSHSLYIELKHIPFTVLHPFKGFYEIKAGDRGNYILSVSLFVILSVMMFIRRTATAFLFRSDQADVENLLRSVGSTLLIILLWIGVLFLLEIFLGGEAKFSHVVHSTAISLYPAIIAHISAVLLTYMASVDDAAMINAITGIGWVWTIFLIFTGILVTNDYTMTRTIISVIVNIAGMLVVFLISVLFISLLQDMLIFVSFVIREVRGVLSL